MIDLPPRRRPRGRYAPSPSARLHLGNGRTALAAWLSARAQSGEFVLRIEDLDAPRVVSWGERAAMEDLAWLGINWDEGPDVGGPHAPYRQSERGRYYDEALQRLCATRRIFPCRRSRKDLRDLASAPHSSGGSPYPAHFRPRSLSAGWFTSLAASQEAAIRFAVDEAPVRFEDLVMGPSVEDVRTSIGDFVLRRRDGVYAYQLAVVVDDLAMDVTEVVRGRDLLDSTARQIQLIEALGGPRPKYAHVPLVVNERGEKLSKRDAGLTIAALRAEGIEARQLCGYLAHSLGLIPSPSPITAADLIPYFRWDRMPTADWTVSDNVANEIRRITVHG